MKKILVVMSSLLVVLFLAWIAFGYFSVRGLEEPSYTVILEKDFYEIRKYDDYIIAETRVEGEYRDALSSGFRVIADYIFGNNVGNEQISMTTPVVTKEELSEKIAMTVPVISGDEGAQWTLAFVMPGKYTLESLPKAKTDKISFKEVEGRTIAVHGFSWYVSEERLKRKTAELIEALMADGYTVGEIKSARYNPPFSPPFMYRNEIWADIRE